MTFDVLYYVDRRGWHCARISWTQGMWRRRYIVKGNDEHSVFMKVAEVVWGIKRGEV